MGYELFELIGDARRHCGLKLLFTASIPIVVTQREGIQFSSVTQSCLTLCDPMDCSTPGFPVHHQLLELAQTPRSLDGWWCHPTISSSVIPFSSCPQSFPASWSFFNKSVLCIRWPKYWSFSFSISPSNEYSGLISFRFDWFDLLASPRDSQESSPTPQYKSINSSVFSFLYGPTVTSYMTTGKTIALTKWTLVGKVMSLRFNMLSRLVIAFLPRSKCLFISRLQSPSAVILEPKK